VRRAANGLPTNVLAEGGTEGYGSSGPNRKAAGQVPCGRPWCQGIMAADDGSTPPSPTTTVRAGQRHGRTPPGVRRPLPTDWHITDGPDLADVWHVSLGESESVTPRP
jgi:hypothetical protein